MGDGPQIGGVIAAEGTRLSGASRKTEDPRWSEIALILKNSPHRLYIEEGRINLKYSC